MRPRCCLPKNTSVVFLSWYFCAVFFCFTCVLSNFCYVFYSIFLFAGIFLSWSHRSTLLRWGPPFDLFLDPLILGQWNIKNKLKSLVTRFNLTMRGMKMVQRPILDFNVKIWSLTGDTWVTLWWRSHPVAQSSRDLRIFWFILGQILHCREFRK